MGARDIETKKYMSDPAVFADVFNYFLYGGERVIDPDGLLPLDATEVVVPYGNKGRTPLQRIRDVMKEWCMMKDNSTVYALLGIENQSNIHYAMPVKAGLNDYMAYAEQVEEASKSYHQNRNKKRRRQLLRMKGNEYLSGFRKEDRLIPVLTLVVYYGSHEWDAPRSIHEMLLVKDKRLLPYVPDYRVNLITPEDISDEDIDLFESGFGELMLFIKYSHDKKRLKKLMDDHEQFTCLDSDTANLINVLTDSKLTITEEDGGINMCQAILDIRAEGKEEFQMHIAQLTLAMKKDNREAELIDALIHPEKLPPLFEEYKIQ